MEVFFSSFILTVSADDASLRYASGCHSNIYVFWTILRCFLIYGYANLFNYLMHRFTVDVMLVSSNAHSTMSPLVQLIALCFCGPQMAGLNPVGTVRAVTFSGN